MAPFLILLTVIFSIRHTYAESDSALMTLSNENGIVEKMRRAHLQWQLSWRVGNEEEVTANAGIDAPVGERVATLNVEGRRQQKTLTGFQCEESRRTTAGFRQGRCSFLLTACTPDEKREVFFHYRVLQSTDDYKAGTTAAMSRRSKLYEETDNGGDGVEIGAVTYRTEIAGEKDYDPGINIILQLQRASAGGTDCQNWIPSSVKFEGMSAVEVAERNWRRRAATSAMERWGYPLIFVVALYGSLRIAAEAVSRRRQVPVAPKDRKTR
uniref:Uncharacterized protein n=1 Tax=Trypanosoma congolense (strain IL3000) TaxID=1068625 RepID=G0USN3_TRYCI|nr:conserved hypothetical protein [Trypanosoma congolense IL3000]